MNNNQEKKLREAFRYKAAMSIKADKAGFWNMIGFYGIGNNEPKPTPKAIDINDIPETEYIQL